MKQFGVAFLEADDGVLFALERFGKGEFAILFALGGTLRQNGITVRASPSLAELFTEFGLEDG